LELINALVDATESVVP